VRGGDFCETFVQKIVMGLLSAGLPPEEASKSNDNVLEHRKKLKLGLWD